MMYFKAGTAISHVKTSMISYLCAKIDSITRTQTSLSKRKTSNHPYSNKSKIVSGRSAMNSKQNTIQGRKKEIGNKDRTIE